MYIKIYECKKCGSHNFFMKKVHLHAQYGIYCAECGAWYKWGNKDDVQLFSYHKDLIFS